MILADKIIDERKKNGWSQEELADRLGVSRQSVSKWESAQSVPDLQRILEMSKIFGVSTDYLLKDEEGVRVTTDAEYTEVYTRRVSMEEANEYLDERFLAKDLLRRLTLRSVADHFDRLSGAAERRSFVLNGKCSRGRRCDRASGDDRRRVDILHSVRHRPRKMGVAQQGSL